MARAGWKSFAPVPHNLVAARVATVNSGAVVKVSASLHGFRRRLCWILACPSYGCPWVVRSAGLVRRWLTLLRVRLGFPKKFAGGEEAFGASKVHMRLPSPPKCSYCKRKFRGAGDHVVPKIRGGPDDDWNRVPVCQECNGMLSYYLPARDADTIGRIRWKKELFLRSCRKALRKSSAWRRLSKDERWEEIRRGLWTRFLPVNLQHKYEEGRQTKGRLIGQGPGARWRSSKSSQMPKGTRKPRIRRG